MKKTANVLMVGVGGQGTVLSSNIMSLAAMYDGYDVKKSEIHGMSQRGGSVFSHVRFGEKVYSAVIPKHEADVLLALEEIETLRWLEYLKPGGKIICLKENILPANVEEYPQGAAVFIEKNFADCCLVDPKELKATLKNTKVLNVALLGVLSNTLEISDESWKKAIMELTPEGTGELNIKAFETGKQLMSD